MPPDHIILIVCLLEIFLISYCRFEVLDIVSKLIKFEIIFSHYPRENGMGRQKVTKSTTRW